MRLSSSYCYSSYASEYISLGISEEMYLLNSSLTMQEKLYQWILRKHDEEARLTVAEIMSHIQVQPWNLIDYGAASLLETCFYYALPNFVFTRHTRFDLHKQLLAVHLLWYLFRPCLDVMYFWIIGKLVKFCKIYFGFQNFWVFGCNRRFSFLKPWYCQNYSQGLQTPTEDFFFPKLRFCTSLA